MFFSFVCIFFILRSRYDSILAEGPEIRIFFKDTAKSQSGPRMLDLHYLSYYDGVDDGRRKRKKKDYKERRKKKQ